MIKIINKKLSNKTHIIHTDIINNILYIFCYHEGVNDDNYIYGSSVVDFYLKKFDLITGKNNEMFLFSGDRNIIYNDNIEICGDKLYIFNNHYIYEYKINDKFLNDIYKNKYINCENNINNENFNLPFNLPFNEFYKDKISKSLNDLLKEFVEEALNIKNIIYYNMKLLRVIKIIIYDIIVYNNTPYFLIYHKNKYLFINFDGYILFEFIDLDCDKNKAIKINTKIESCVIKTYKDYVIFYDENIVIYNIKTREIIEFKKFCFILSDRKFSHSVDNKQYVYDIENNKNYTLDKFLNKKKPMYINDIPNKILLGIDNYYLTFDNKTYKLNLYMNNIKNNSLINDNNLIKFGTNEKYVYLPIKYLLNSSELIKGMYSNIDNIKEIIHSSFEYVDLYHDFIKGDKVDDLYNLFKICNLLIDKNVENVGELIIKNIKYNKIDIDESFRYLEMFSTCIHYYLFQKLFYVIVDKYELNIVNNKFDELNKNTQLYNFCFKEMLNYIKTH